MGAAAAAATASATSFVASRACALEAGGSSAAGSPMDQAACGRGSVGHAARLSVRVGEDTGKQELSVIQLSMFKWSTPQKGGLRKDRERRGGRRPRPCFGSREQAGEGCRLRADRWPAPHRGRALRQRSAAKARLSLRPGRHWLMRLMPSWTQSVLRSSRRSCPEKVLEPLLSRAAAG